MTDKYIDFDSYLEEKKDDVITIKMFNKDIEIPSQPPLNLMLKVIDFNKKRKKEDTLAEEEIMLMLKQLLGEEQFDMLVNNNVTTEHAEWLVTKIMNIYKGIEQDDTKNLTHSTSQNTGEQLKQTSKENTE